MGILTLGLLGVAALFPVGAFYMEKASIADRGSAIAQSVMSDILSRGMLNPGAWMMMTPNPNSNAPRVWNTLFPSDGKYCPVPARPSTFTRPFAETLSQALAQAAANPNPPGDPAIISKQFGAAFVIDPIGAAALAVRDASGNAGIKRVARPFPASMFQFPNWTAAYMGSVPQWSTWGSPANSWPVRRVTFQQSDGWSLDPTMAEHYFRGADDLSTDLPDRDDRPASQNWDIASLPSTGRTPMARQSQGDYSWIVTVVPTTKAALEGMARNPEGFEYDVTVVVFYKRLLPTSFPADPLETIEASAFERSVKVSIVSTGLNGGELLLQRLDDNITESPFDQLKAGQWMMVCGPHPNSSVSEPRFVLNWYQVLAIDKEGARVTPFDPESQRVVAVRGPQWPWQPANSLTAPGLSNNLCAGIFRGAVAVHAKTLRLESPRTSPKSVIVPAGVSDPKEAF